MTLRATAGCALLGGVLAVATPAQAWCPGEDGTIPGMGPQTVTVATPAATVYVDEADFLDVDDDGDGGRLRIYLESNGREGLQRGADNVVFATLAGHGINPTVPRINPMWVGVPGTGIGITLFPSCFWCGHSLQQALGAYDDCIESAAPDTLLV